MTRIKRVGFWNQRVDKRLFGLTMMSVGTVGIVISGILFAPDIREGFAENWFMVLVGAASLLYLWL